jgi:DNA-binding NarL/FixJ family response regulator
MTGLSCTISDVVRLALDELRNRYPSPKKLEAALREHVWRDRAGQVGQLQLPGVRLQSVSPPHPRTARPAQAIDREGPIQVVVVADHPTFRAGLTGVLAGRSDIEVVGEVGDVAAALGLARRRHPQVVLLDLSESPNADGVAALVKMRPGVAVVVLATTADRERVLAAVEAGAAGYLPRDAGPDELARVIRAVAQGELPHALRTALELVAAPPGRTPRASLLTPREREVLTLVGRGLANKQIAGRLGISEKTVKTHLGRAFQRIGVSDRTQAALWAERDGLLA